MKITNGSQRRARGVVAWRRDGAAPPLNRCTIQTSVVQHPAELKLHETNWVLHRHASTTDCKPTEGGVKHRKSLFDASNHEEQAEQWSTPSEGG